jgi:hypothetical protein
MGNPDVSGLPPLLELSAAAPMRGSRPRGRTNDARGHPFLPSRTYGNALTASR